MRQDRDAFLAERRRAIGGSDVRHLVTMDRGCARRLWYEKKGVPEDFPVIENLDMRRGSALEAHAIEEFNRQAPYLAVPSQEWFTAADDAHIGCHPDALVKKMRSELVEGGVLEVKCPRSRNWYQMRIDGPSTAAQLQLQWEMMVLGLGWGVICAFNADTWSCHWWELQRDDDLVEDLLQLGLDFWASLSQDENPQPQLERSDPTCRSCPYRKTCQGIGEAWVPPEDLADPAEPDEIDEGIFDVFADYLAARQAAKWSEQALDLAKEELKAALGGRPRKVRCSLGRVVYQQGFRKAHSVKEWKGMVLRVVPFKKEEEDDGQE